MQILSASAYFSWSSANKYKGLKYHREKLTQDLDINMLYHQTKLEILRNIAMFFELVGQTTELMDHKDKNMVAKPRCLKLVAFSKFPHLWWKKVRRLWD